MPRSTGKSSLHKQHKASPPEASARRLVLVVDADEQTAACVQRALATSANAHLLRAATLAEARAVMASQIIDVALIGDTLGDGDGLALACDLAEGRRPVQVVMLASRPSFNLAVQAMRQGVCGLLVKPLDSRELSGALADALARQQRESWRLERIRRLRRICRKLNAMREEVTQQVDILCNDLVNAYQELASQMTSVSQTCEFGSIIKDELDLEKVLRRTLEYLVNKAGPTNAAIFLPSSMDEFTLGGYVNYDCDADSADVLLEHMADIVAPRISESGNAGPGGSECPLVHFTDNASLVEWIGDDAAYFEDSHVIGFASKHEGETLAVLVLFRDGSDPFTAELLDTCAAVGPVLASYLARIIRIHHRQLASGPLPGEGEDVLPF